ncbi:MAG: rod shape-determining protein MreD [Thermomicrobiales bacterium]|nr:rod shape-determining protein MreD [Thermomicrobiales bacterium]
MASVILAIALIFFAFMQSTVFPSSELIGIYPDVTLVIILVWSAVRGARDGLMWAFVAGILLDTLALDPLGGNALALLPVVLLGAFSRRAFFQSSLIVPIVACVVATFLHAFLLLLVRSAGGDSIAIGPLIRIIMLQTVLNVMIVPPIYLLGSLAQRPVSSRNV